MASILVNPYISLQGNAREALTFYKDVFGGQLNMNTFGEFGLDDAAYRDQIAHGQLTSPRGFTLMASDTPPGQEPKSGSSVSVCVSGDDADELRGYWQKLSDSGTISVPLERQMWGDEFGTCTDRFGVEWLININQQTTPPA